nr:hypothetical protein [uncultured Noviherbaspirillum sp.]
MTPSDQRLAQAIKLRFGTAPGEPNEPQLNLIKTAIGKIKASGAIPTEGDWAKTVLIHCPSAGTYKYAGVDNSDLNTLLALATNNTK